MSYPLDGKGRELTIPNRMHFVLLVTDAGLKFLSPLGLFCGLASIVSGVTLYTQHQEISQGSAGEGVRKLSASDQRHLNTLSTVFLPLGA